MYKADFMKEFVTKHPGEREWGFKDYGMRENVHCGLTRNNRRFWT